MEKLSIIIPVYNEKNTIKSVLDLVRKSDTGNIKKEIIIVDDFSTDGTREILKNLENEYKIIYHKKNKGKGGALKTGFKEATGDYIIIQDADLEYDPNDYIKLIERVVENKADIVFGSRILRENNVPFSSVYFYGGLAVCKFFNLAFGTKFSDITTCYKLFPRRMVSELLSCPANDFVFDAVELTHVLSRNGKVIEVPIKYEARKRKEGKKLS
ncbi:MAG: glycosyl transferase, partial [Candidatus Niyogibacteria bacterium CG10_big_fil_rev_8_21_14_0_10_42_19]